MDKVPALKQAHALSTIHAKCINAMSALRGTLVNGEKQLDSLKKWRLELQEGQPDLRLTAADNSGVQSKSDELRSLLTSQCAGLVLQVRSALEDRQKSGFEAGALNVLEIQNLSNSIQLLEKGLNNDLARYEWVSITESIRELRAKNTRLGANRAVEISKLSDRVDERFRIITSHGSSVDSKPTAWHAINELMPRVIDFTVEQTILTTLQFWTMEQRKELIEKEYKDTFGWILSDQTSKCSSVQKTFSFAEWLARDEALYWISGKPGSGKSTLMKYISESRKTWDILDTSWTKKDKLVMAEFYFWSSAKDSLLKSGTGLMRSILFQILRQCPDMLQHAYPKEWDGRYSSQVALRKLVREGQTMQELLDTFKRIAALLPETRTKFCFFIDGLDEFDGDPADICRLIESFKSIKNLKLCVSSRPWTQFEEVFGGDNPWKVYIHEKTRLDMEKYVNGLLAGNGISSEGSAGNLDVTALVTAIAEKAEGVFLWSFFAVRDLTAIVSNAERDNFLTAMMATLETIPSDLDSYFNKMFQSTPNDMRPKAAQVFQITLDAVEKLPLLCYWLIQKVNLENMLQPEHSLVLEPRSRALSSALRDLRRFSKGLLHVKGALKADSIPAEVLETEFFFGFRVDFIHRTVADFLYTSGMRQLFRTWNTASSGIDVDICRGSVATLKAIPQSTAMFDDGSCVLSILHLALSHVKTVEKSLQTRILDCIFKVLQEHAKAYADFPLKILGPGNYWAYGANFSFIFLYQCVSYNLSTYVTHQLAAKDLAFSEKPSGLLSACFSWDNRVRSGQFALSSDTVKDLLRAGLDPNLPWGDRDFSFWQQLLTSTYSRHLKGTTNTEDFTAIRYAIEHGADLGAEVEILARRSAGGVKALELVDKILPQEQKPALHANMN